MPNRPKLSFGERAEMACEITLCSDCGEKIFRDTGEYQDLSLFDRGWVTLAGGAQSCGTSGYRHMPI